MRAVVAERPDGPDGLVVREVPRPEPRPGWALVRVEAFGLNRSEYKTLKGYAGDAVTFPRILGIELVGVVEAVHGDAPAVPPGETVAALMGDMGRAFDGGYAEYALVPEHQLIALDTTLPWDVLGALPETFATAAGSLEHLDLEEGETLLLRVVAITRTPAAWASWRQARPTEDVAPRSSSVSPSSRSRCASEPAAVMNVSGSAPSTSHGSVVSRVISWCSGTSAYSA